MKMGPMSGRRDLPVAERLLAQTRFEPQTGCLIPTKAPYNKYGSCQIRLNGKLYTMRHVAFALSGGDLKIGEVVGRTCDNAACICPLHLCAMTRSESNKLAFERGRVPTTRKLNRARADWLREVAARPVRIADLAEMFGISECHARKILKGGAWS